MPTNALTLTGDLPATPLVVLAGDTIARVASLTTDAAAVTALNTPADANNAAQLLREIAGLNRDIEKARVEVVAPFLDFQRRINAAAKAEQAKLDTAEKTLRTRLAGYQAEQERKAREEAERQRKEQERLAAEARKLEEERARLQREADARAAAQAKLDATPDADLVDIDEDDGMADLAADVQQESIAEQQAAIAAQAAQVAAASRAVAAVKPQGIHYRTTLKHAVTDIRRLPENLVIITPNDAEIRRLFVTGWKEGDPVPNVPGITFTVEQTVVVAGRR